MNRESILNPYGTLNKALNSSVSVTKLTLARPAVRRSLESGKTVTIVLDSNGSLLYARRGRLEIRDAIQMRKGGRCIIELVARKEQCRSGTRDFFGYIQGAPFEKFAVRRMTQPQKQSLLELLLSLNECNNLGSNHNRIDLVSLTKPHVKWFQVPRGIAVAMKDRELEEEQEMDQIEGNGYGGSKSTRGVLNFYKY